MSDTPSIRSSSRVRHVAPGQVAFRQLNSWYKVPPELEPIFRAAKEADREVTFTADPACNILTVETDDAALDRARDKASDEKAGTTKSPGR